MKEKIYLLLFALLLICLLLGVNLRAKEKENGKIVGLSDEIYIVEVEGHKYVIYDGYNQGGIVHAESCSCKERENK